MLRRVLGFPCSEPLIVGFLAEQGLQKMKYKILFKRRYEKDRFALHESTNDPQSINKANRLFDRKSSNIAAMIGTSVVIISAPLSIFILECFCESRCGSEMILFYVFSISFVSFCVTFFSVRKTINEYKMKISHVSIVGKISYSQMYVAAAFFIFMILISPLLIYHIVFFGEYCRDGWIFIPAVLLSILSCLSVSMLFMVSIWIKSILLLKSRQVPHIYDRGEEI